MDADTDDHGEERIPFPGMEVNVEDADLEISGRKGFIFPVERELKKQFDEEGRRI